MAAFNPANLFAKFNALALQLVKNADVVATDVAGKDKKQAVEDGLTGVAQEVALIAPQYALAAQLAAVAAAETIDIICAIRSMFRKPVAAVPVVPVTPLAHV